MAVRGWVYVLTNRAMAGLVKIGFSTKDPSLRAAELEGTGLPHPFEVVFDVLVIEPQAVEQAVHKLLKAQHESKEFFKTDPAAAARAIREAISMQGKKILLENSSAIDVAPAQKTDPNSRYWQLSVWELRLVSPSGDVIQITESNLRYGQGIKIGHDLIWRQEIRLEGDKDSLKKFRFKWNF
jgi:hypothetical protein